MVDFDKLLIDRITDVSMYNKSTGELLFYVDELKGGSLENGAEKSFITGSAGVRLAALNRNQTTRFTCQNGYISMAGMTAQFGTEKVMGTAAAKIPTHVYEVATTSDGTSLTLGNTPYAMITGKPVPFVYKRNADGSPGTKYAAGASVSAEAFTISGSTVTLPTSAFAANDKVIVPYWYEEENAIKLTRTNTSFAKDGRVIVGILAKDPCDKGKVYYTQLVMDDASAEGNLTLNFGDDMVHDFSCEALPSMCDGTKEFFHWIIPDPAVA